MASDGDLMEAADWAEGEAELLREEVAALRGRVAMLTEALEACDCEYCLLDEQRIAALAAAPDAPYDPATRLYRRAWFYDYPEETR